MPKKEVDNMTISPADIPQKRQEERARVNLDGPTLRQSDGMIGSVKLHDVSSRGFRTDWPEKLLPGDKVWLKLPGVDELPATVAWELDLMIGCKFEVALRPAVFAKIINQTR